METEPVEGIDEHQSGETPEDVAILYSWANLQGAKYRDFSANRREYRAQMRHRAAEQLRLMELRAQSEAEAAAAQAEAEAAAAHAEADAATVKLAASRSTPSIEPEAILREKEVEEIRSASLREAAQQARKAAAERLEAARRAEAAALADSIARREEHEISEAQASALRQAAQYHDSEVRNKELMARHPNSEDQVPGRISDPYSPQILAEGEYYDGPGTPPSELVASRFRTQREYIERSTGTELPRFKMPPLFDENPPIQGTEQGSGQARPEFPPHDMPRRLSDMNPDDREFFIERHLREERNTSIPLKEWPGRQQHEALHDALSWERKAGSVVPHGAPPEPYGKSPGVERAEIVSRIPQDRLPQDRIPQANDVPCQGSDRTDKEAEGDPGKNWGYDGSLLDRAIESPRRQRGWAGAEGDQTEWESGHDAEWRPQRSEVPAAIREAQHAAQRREEQRRAENEPPQLYSATPRPSGSWLRQISAREPEANSWRGPSVPQVPIRVPVQEKRTETRTEPIYSRPSVEAAYSEGLRSESTSRDDQQPSGFRPPWLSQVQAPRQSGSRRVIKDPPEPEWPAPRWLYPGQAETPAHTLGGPTAPQALVTPKIDPKDLQSDEPAAEHPADAGNTLQAAQEKVASRWFALKNVFAHTDAPQNPEQQTFPEKSSTPIIAVYSLAGGVGKTSLVATLGRTLSSLGERVLLTDTTSHGLMPFYFGAKHLISGVVRTFLPPNGSSDAPVHMVSYDLGRRPPDDQAQGRLADGLLVSGQRVDRILIDLGANCEWLVERIASLKPVVMVPVATDMNSLISLQTLEKKFAAMQSADGEPLRPVYLLNQFDASLPLHLDLREVLRQQLGDRLLPFVIRRAQGISEALAEGMTIVDYDPDSAAAQDFLGLANWVRAASVPASTGPRTMRWSER